MNKETNGKKFSEYLLKIVFTAMFAALIFLATTIFRVPSPLGGNLNFGDCFILVAAWVLGPAWGFAAGGIGSALSDIIGYPTYAPGTFIVKGLMAVAASLIAHAMMKRSEKLRLPGFVLGAVSAEVIMVAGYYLYESTFLGFGFVATLVNVVPNIVQGVFGAVLGIVIAQIVAKTGALKKILATYTV